MYSLHKNIGEESLTKEYKSIYLNNISSYFNESQLQQLVETKMFYSSQFNYMIYEIVSLNIKKYIPKYLGNFSKAHIQGSLFFGVDDFGFIEGIPLFNVDKNTFRQYIIDKIANTMKNVRNIRDNTEYNYVKWFYDNMIINVHELTIFETDCTEIKIELDKCINHNSNIMKAYKEYIIRYQIWHNKLSKYTCKLINYFTNTTLKNELIEFVRKVAPKNRIDQFIKFYNSEAYKSIQFEINNIEIISQSPDDPIYWLLKFKDKMLQSIKLTKPHKLNDKPNKYVYSNFLANMHNFGPILLKLNIKPIFYMIEIIIPSRPDNYLEYRFSKKSEWISKTRVIINNDPCCE